MTHSYRNILLSFLFLTNISVCAASYIVSANGQGDYKSIQEAVDNLRAFSPVPHTLYVKPGVYKEKIVIPTWLTNLTIIGEDLEKTIIVWDDYSGKTKKLTTFNSYTILVSGNDITFKNITIENNAEPLGQAVAIHIEGDRVVFENCKILGNQDTVYLGREGARIFFHNCYINGTTDFIFGPSTAYFKDCIIHSKRNSYITAASTPEFIKYGFVFDNCKLTADADVTKVYLGRPWRDFAKTVYINCQMDKHIRDEGWHNWGRPEAEKSTFYAEYGTTGEGANDKSRASWSHILKQKEAKDFSLEKVLKGYDNWMPLTNNFEN